MRNYIRTVSVLTLLLGASVAFGQGIITTMAGTQIPSCGVLGDGGPATSAGLCNPRGLATDTSGNVYFYDLGYYRIRKVSPDGIISTIAGNGTHGTTGDGGPALTAALGSTQYMAWSNTPVSWGVPSPINGQLCFADIDANKIRCVFLDTGVIQSYGSGIANFGGQGDGGPFAGATFESLSGMTFDATGNLYIADFSDNRVRKVDAVTGIINTFAGPGPGYCCSPLGDGGPAASANLYEPQGLTYANGGLYIADTGNVRVRRVDLTTNTITTVAGNGTYSSAPDGTMATAGGVQGSLIAADGAGNLFVSGRMVNASGIITTIAGQPGVSGWGYDDIPATQTAFGGGFGLAWDSVAQRVLYGDSTRIRQVFFTPPTTTTLTTPQNPMVPTPAVSLQATVLPSDATGIARFYDGYNGATPGQLLGTAPLIDGVATFSWAAPPGASTQVLTAVYGGDPTHNLSMSNIVNQVFQWGHATNTLASSLNPSQPGQSVTFTATFIPSVVTGMVGFYDNSNYLGSGTLQNGVATLTTSSLAAGGHPITTIYNGDSYYSGNSSPVLPQNVGNVTTSTTAVVATPNPVSQGTLVTFNASVNPPTATGTVQFFINGQAQGSGTLSNGTASFGTFLNQGSYQVYATYLGDSSDSVSTSAVITEVVNPKPATTTVLASSQNPSAPGAAITLSATVTPSNVTGSVQFLDGVTVLSTVGISGGIATYNTSTLAQGPHSLTAVYGGDFSHAGSTSSVLTQAVQIAAGLTFSLNPTTISAGQTVTLTANVNAAATGTVKFTDGSTVLSTVTVTAGAASYSTSFTAGAHLITATYSGDNTYMPASSGVNQTVLAVSSVALKSSLSPAPLGQNVVFTATVTPATATGTVQFLDGATAIGTGTIAGGVASVATAALTAGSHTITASYAGDASDATASSTPLTQVILTGSTVTVSSSLNPSVAGQSMSLTANLTPATATGTVQFLDGATVLGTATISSGVASFTTSALTAGSHSITAAYSGDSTYASATSAVLTQSVKAASTVSLATNPNPSAMGQSMTMTATVTPAAATGTVQFLDGASVLSTATIASGVATFSTTTLTRGTHSITAAYSGDSNYGTSTSSAIPQVVNPAAAAVTLTSSQNPSNAGSSVTLTAAITPSTATGTMQFFSGSTSLGTINVTGGQAQLSTAWLPTGADSLTAAYSGDSNNGSSTSTALAQTVNPAVTSLTVAVAGSNPSQYGQNVILTALLTSNAVTTGSIQFSNGATVLGTAPLNNGFAQFATTTLPVGVASLTASYAGDANNGSSSSTAAQVTVVKVYTTATIAANPTTSISGQAVTLTVTLVPATATGTVQFVGAPALGTATVSSGVAQITTTALPVGTTSVGAIYSGDANDAATTPNAINVTVNPKTVTSTTLTSAVNPSTYGSAATFTATVSPAAATGTVQFLDGGALLGTAAVLGGSSSFSTSALAGGTHSITAVYSGDATNATSTSGVVTQTVKLTTALSLQSALNPSVVGQAITFTAAVAASGTASGTVQFLDGGTVLGTVSLSSNVAQFSTAGLSQGARSVSAIYSGDSNYIGSNASLTQTVNPKTSTATALASSWNPAIVSGGTVTFTANVSPMSATGTVQFLDGATVLGTATLVNGAATFGSSTLSLGTHSITAVYSGNATTLGSTSAVLTQSVKQLPGLNPTITPSPSAVAGHAVTLKATMNTAATGTVTFTDGATVLAAVQVSAGSASYSTSTLAAGVHSLGISYGGDGTFISAGANLNETILAASTLLLSSSANPAATGQSVTFTANVTPASATGTVQFFDGATLLGTSSVSAGLAQFATSALAKGSHSVTATYSGDSADAAATSNAVTEVIRTASTISLTSSVNPSVVNQSVKFTATITPSAATGTVQFLDGATVLSTVTVSGGAASFTTTQLAAGTHSITAIYGGNSNDAPATSTVLNQIVNVPPPGAPSGLVARAAGSNQVNLSWTASSTSGVTYDVYSSTSSGFTPSSSNRIASGVTDTTYSSTGLVANTTYYFRVTAVDSGGESAATSQASAKTGH